MTRTCERILQKWQLSCTSISQDLRIYGGLIVDLMIWSSLSLQFLCFDSCFPQLWEFFVTFEITASFERNIHLFPVELTIYYARFSRSFVFFLPITCQRTGLLLKEEIFCHQYSPWTNFHGFYLIGHQPSHAWVTLKILAKSIADSSGE